MSDVFLSYSHDDHSRAKEVAERLEAGGLSVWWDNNLRRGRFTDQIEGELAKARCVVVLWSNTSGEGDWVPAEADRGRIENKLVQVRLDLGCKVPMPFDRLHILELVDWGAERGDEELRAVVEAARETAKRSPMARKLARAQRLWKPRPVSQLRPWDTWLGTMLLLAALAIAGVWAYGFFHHEELALYLSLVFLVWIAWLALRALIARRLANRRIGWRKALTGVAAVAALGTLWTLWIHNFYDIEPFEDGVKGFYVTRLNGDRWDQQQTETVEKLQDLIDGLDPSLKVKEIPRRNPDTEEALRLVARGNALLLMAGSVRRSAGKETAGLEARLVQREAPGLLRGRARLAESDALASQASVGSGDPNDLLAAIALFFAGYAEFLEGPPYNTAVNRLTDSLHLLRTLSGEEKSLAEGLGVTASFRATAALFLGNCRFEQKKLAEALELYEEARDTTAKAKGPQFFEALVNIAAVHVEAGRYDEAHETLQEAEVCRVGQSTPASWLRFLRCAYLHHGLGVTLTLQGQHERGRPQLAEAVEFTRRALDAGAAREETVAFQSLSQQKWAWSAAKQVEKGRVEGLCAEGDCSDLLSEAEGSLERAALSWPEGQELAPFRITRARIAILNSKWPEAEGALEALQTKGADREEPEVLLLLAIARMCGDSAEDPGASVSRFIDYHKGSFAGMQYFRYWSNRCPPEGESS